MTDKQVIRAFKGCKYSMLECTDCPYGNNMNCERDLDKDVVTLLERQRSEIDKLKKALENRDEADRIAVEAYEQLLYEVDYQQAEIERLKRKIKEQGEIIANDNFAEFYVHKHSMENIEGYTADIYKRAIKEFEAEIRKRKTTVNGIPVYLIEPVILDMLIKEMVGADNG